MRDFASYLMDHMNEIKISGVVSNDRSYMSPNFDFKMFREGVYCFDVSQSYKFLIPWTSIDEVLIQNV